MGGEESDGHRHRRRRRHGKTQRHRHKSSTPDDMKRRHVKLSPIIDEIPIGCDSSPSGDTVITLTKSEERYREFMNSSDDAEAEQMAKQNGWCFDGRPWGYDQMPKDEAALLKKGVVDPHGSRLTYCAPECAMGSSMAMGRPHFYDEIELYKKGLCAPKVPNNFRPRVTASPLSVEPINVAELNSRGFLDQNGQIHYGLKTLTGSRHGRKAKKPPKTSSPKVTLCDSHESISIVKTPPYDPDLYEPQTSETRVSFSPSRDYSSPNSASKESKKRCTPPASVPLSPASDVTTGVIRCEAGYTNDERAIMNYTVTSDGRNYELQTNDGHLLHLEFNKKHAYLIVD